MENEINLELIKNIFRGIRLTTLKTLQFEYYENMSHIFYRQNDQQKIYEQLKTLEQKIFDQLKKHLLETQAMYLLGKN